IEAHGHAEVVFAVVNTQIGDFVGRLSDYIAAASQKNHRNYGYRENSQQPQHAHRFSFWAGQSLRAEMTGEVRQVRLGALAVRVQLREELIHNLTNS
ncbi:MAG: hypothetical protein WAN72_19720, partial [Candidatus Acidiferrales bacterium]